MKSKLVAAALACVLGFTTAAQGTTYYWSGATNANMSGTAGNWGGTVPGASDIAAWDATAYTNPPTANAAMTLGQLWFTANNTVGVTFGTGANTLTLNGISEIGLQIDSGSGSVGTGSAKFKIGASQSWVNNSASTLTIGGTIANSDNTTKKTLAIDGTGNTILNGVISDGGTTGTLAITKIGSGKLTFASVNPFSGGLNVYAGTLQQGYNNNTLGTGTISLGDTTSGNNNNATITLIAPSRGDAAPIVVNAGSSGKLAIIVYYTSGGSSGFDFTLSGNVTLNHDLTLALTGQTGGGIWDRMVFSGVVSGGSNIYIGDSTYTNKANVKLSNTNTFTGTTTIKSGILWLANSLAIQNSTLDAANSISGGLRTDQTSLTMGSLSGTKNLRDLFSAAAFNSVNYGGYANVASLTLNPGVGVSSTYGGVITNGAAGMTLTKTGAGTQTLTNTLSYSGATTVSNGVLDVSSAPTFASTNWTLAASGTLKVGTTALSGKNLAVGVDGTGAGLLDVTGNLTLGGNLTVTGTSTGARKIAQSTGAISGTFSTTALPSGFILTLRNSKTELWVGTPAGTMVRFF
jgi:autotransporter-associated beta strand protein